jgi:hypothetical protein
LEDGLFENLDRFRGSEGPHRHVLQAVMPRLPLFLSAALILGACDSDDSGEPVDTDTPTTGANGSSEDGDGDGDGGTSTTPNPGSTSTPSGSSESGQDPTGDPSTTSGTSDGDTSVGDETGDPSTTGGLVPQLPPGDVESLIAWLEAGEYDDWAAESGIHESTGPHFGNVRTFFNNVLVDSFEGGEAVHPIGAANVKELYGPGQSIRGWAVMVKREVDAGQWYWFEVWDGDVLADTVAWDVCEGCHSDGVDNVLTPWPLQ